MLLGGTQTFLSQSCRASPDSVVDFVLPRVYTVDVCDQNSKTYRLIIGGFIIMYKDPQLLALGEDVNTTESCCDQDKPSGS